MYGSYRDSLTEPGYKESKLDTGEDRMTLRRDGAKSLEQIV